MVLQGAMQCGRGLFRDADRAALSADWLEIAESLDDTQLCISEYNRESPEAAVHAYLFSLTAILHSVVYLSVIVTKRGQVALVHPSYRSVTALAEIC